MWFIFSRGQINVNSLNIDKFAVYMNYLDFRQVFINNIHS